MIRGDEGRSCPSGRASTPLAEEFQGGRVAANQGLYNGFLAAGLIWSLIHPNGAIGFQIAMFFLLCVIIAGLYGGYSVSKRIVMVQALPAALALICVWLAR